MSEFTLSKQINLNIDSDKKVYTLFFAMIVIIVLLLIANYILTSFKTYLSVPPGIP